MERGLRSQRQPPGAGEGGEENIQRQEKAEAASTHSEIQTGGEGGQLDQTSGLLMNEQFPQMQTFKCQKEANQDGWSPWEGGSNNYKHTRLTANVRHTAQRPSC